MNELLSRYDISAISGFLPDTPPPQDLTPLFPNSSWAQLERLVRSAPDELSLGSPDSLKGESGAKWRRELETLDVPDVSMLQEVSQKRRALVVLHFVTQFYLHSQNRCSEDSAFIVPYSLGDSTLKLCQELGTQPILNYSTLILWNWSFKDKAKGHNPENYMPTTTFLSSSHPGYASEVHFYQTSLVVECQGSPILQSILSNLTLSSCNTTSSLSSISQAIIKMTDAMHNMSKAIIGSFFYNDIRPWYNGGMYVFSGRDKEKALQRLSLGGATAGQSTLIHSLDAYLGVPHNDSFLRSMIPYMPSAHSTFLSTIPSIRHSILSYENENDKEEATKLRDSYNSAISSLKRFRDIHFQIVTRLVIVESRRQQNRNSNRSKDEKKLQGTAGSDLSQFLKGVRNDTILSTIENPN